MVLKRLAIHQRLVLLLSAPDLAHEVWPIAEEQPVPEYIWMLFAKVLVSIDLGSRDRSPGKECGGQRRHVCVFIINKSLLVRPEQKTVTMRAITF